MIQKTAHRGNRLLLFQPSISPVGCCVSYRSLPITANALISVLMCVLSRCTIADELEYILII